MNSDKSMAQEQCKGNGLQALACYTVDSDFESEEEDGTNNGEVIIKQEIINDAEVTLIKEEVIGVEEKGVVQEIDDENGFGEVVVKSEPLWEYDVEGHRDPQDYLEPQEIKKEIESSSSESESSSDDSDSDDDPSLVIADKANSAQQSKNDDNDNNADTGPVKSKNELLPRELPPVEDLEIRVGMAACQIIGIVSSIVDDLVVIESIPNMPALDLESVLFFKSATGSEHSETVDLTAIGRVFDVIGPVARPFYVVRFNNNDHVKSKGVVVGANIFYSPSSEHTAFIFLEQLMKMKISDASWKDDEEIPFDMREYSDDEQEREAKRERKNAKKGGRGESMINNEVVACKRPRNEVSSQSQSQNSQNGSSRHSNGLYSQENNSFFRQSRGYDPRAVGPIRWSGYNVGQQQNHHQSPPPQFPGPPPVSSQQSYGVPPPGTWPHVPHVAPYVAPGHTSSSTAIQGGGWQGNYNSYNQQQAPPSNPYQNMANRMSHTNNQSQQSNMYGLWRAPPPPPNQSHM